MTLSFIMKFAKLVINKRGSRGSLNLSKIRSKNKQVCENAVTRLQYCPKVLDPHFDEFPGFSGLFDEVSLEMKVRRYFGEFSGRLLS